MEGAAGFVGGECGERRERSERRGIRRICGVGGCKEGTIGEDGVEEVGQEGRGVCWVRGRVCGGEEEGEMEGAAFGGG